VRRDITWGTVASFDTLVVYTPCCFDGSRSSGFQQIKEEVLEIFFVLRLLLRVPFRVSQNKILEGIFIYFYNFAYGSIWL
jgi:hypothetical protein